MYVLLTCTRYKTTCHYRMGYGWGCDGLAMIVGLFLLSPTSNTDASVCGKTEAKMGTPLLSEFLLCLADARARFVSQKVFDAAHTYIAC